LWDTSTGREERAILRNGPVNGLAFSPDGQALAVAAHGDLVTTRLDVRDGRELPALKGQDGNWDVCYDPSGRFLAGACSQRTVQVWDATTGQVVLTLRGHQDIVYRVLYSPDGRRLASASFDRSTKLWDATTGQELLTLPAIGREDALAFSPDGRVLITGNTF